MILIIGTYIPMKYVFINTILFLWYLNYNNFFEWNPNKELDYFLNHFNKYSSYHYENEIDFILNNKKLK